MPVRQSPLEGGRSLNSKSLPSKLELDSLHATLHSTNSGSIRSATINRLCLAAKVLVDEVVRLEARAKLCLEDLAHNEPPSLPPQSQERRRRTYLPVIQSLAQRFAADEHDSLVPVHHAGSALAILRLKSHSGGSHSAGNGGALRLVWSPVALGRDAAKIGAIAQAVGSHNALAFERLSFGDRAGEGKGGEERENDTGGMHSEG